MHYLIQENLFKETHFHVLIDILDRHKMSYEIIKFRPFSEDVEHHTVRKDIFVFGSVSLTNACKKYNWDPGVMYNDNHDMEVYMQKYGKHMLNSDGMCIAYGDKLPDYLPFTFFARPTRDTKVFSGGLFTTDSWNEWQSAVLAADVIKNITDETRIFVAPLKSFIYKEIRCWVVDGKVITISQYKIGDKVIQQNYDHEQEAIDFAQKMADIYCPSRAFVLDICLHNDEYKVVEINCINCSGFYEANMSKLIQALEEAFSFDETLYPIHGGDKEWSPEKLEQMKQIAKDLRSGNFETKIVDGIRTLVQKIK